MAPGNATVGELARRILSQDRIAVYRKDNSLEVPVQQLIQIRNELRAIQVNIDQIMKYFNTSDGGNRRMFDVLKVGERYHDVDDKVASLVGKVAELGEKWLRR